MSASLRAVLGVALLIGGLMAAGSPVASAQTSSVAPSSFRVVAGVSENAVACATTMSCVAVGATTEVSTNGGITWRAAAGPIVQGILADVTCASSTVCIAVGHSSSGGGAVWRSSNAGNTFHAVSVPAIGALSSVGCAASTSCVAAASGAELVSSNGGTSWTKRSAPVRSAASAARSGTICVGVNATHLYYSTNAGSTWTPAAMPAGLHSPTLPTCASSSLCVSSAVDTSFNDVALRSTNGGKSYTAVSLGGLNNPIPFSAIRCQTATRCVAIGPFEIADSVAYNLARTTNGGISWSEANSPDGAMQSALACTSSLCIDVSDSFPTADPSLGVAPIATSTNLGSSWTGRVVSPVGDANAVACPDTVHCMQVNNWGTAVSNDGGNTWHNTDGPSGNAIACVGTAYCFVLSQDADVTEIFQTKNFGATWTIPVTDSAGPNAIACPTSTHCLALSSASGTWDWTVSGGWTRFAGPPWADDAFTNALQCPTSTACYATDSNGNVWASTNAGVNWNLTAQPQTGAGDHLACMSSSICIAAGGTATTNAPRLARTTNGGASWTYPSVPSHDGYTSVFCNTSAHCIATTATSVFESADGGVTWVADHLPTSTGGNDARCRSNVCVVVGPVTLRTP